MKKTILIISAIVVLVGAILIGYPKWELQFSKSHMNAENVDVFIASGSNVQSVGETLVANEIFNDYDQFLEFAETFGYTNENLEPGKYSFKKGQKHKHVIYALKNGNQEVKDVQIVFTYSQNIPSMVSKIYKSIEADSAELVDYILSEQVIQKYGFKNETIISLFLPDTYEVGEWDMSPEEFVSFMAKQYKAFWSEERLALAKSLELSQSEVATLASIVMSEQSKLESEWPIIAGLYLNRLKQGIKLESDPTFKFCWGDELKGVISDLITKTGATTMKDMGRIMGLASKHLAGKADGKAISTIVKELLS